MNYLLQLPLFITVQYEFKFVRFFFSNLIILAVDLNKYQIIFKYSLLETMIQFSVNIYLHVTIDFHSKIQEKLNYYIFHPSLKTLVLIITVLKPK